MTRPLTRMVFAARAQWGRLALASLLGAVALGCGVGLMGTSAWLISRASLHPPILTLTVAVVSVRAFAIGRAVSRYAERLVGHDAALRVLGTLRVSAYERLERLAPAGLPEFRSGDLLARLVADVDAVQDLFVRGLVPIAAATVVAVGSVLFLAWLLPAAAVVLLVALAIGGVVAPWLVSLVGARNERALAPARGLLSISTLDLLQGAPDLLAYGADDEALARVTADDRALTTVERGSARTAGLGALLSGLALAFAVVGGGVVGVPAVRDGRLPGEALAVVVLLPLAVFEAATVLPVAAQTLSRVRRSAERLIELDRAPLPVPEPAVAAPLPAGPYSITAEGLRARYSADAPWVLDGVDLDLQPGSRLAVVGPSGSGKTTLAWTLLRFVDYESGSLRLDRTETRDLESDDVRRVVGLCSQDVHVFDSTLEQNLLLAKSDASPEELRAVLSRARLLDWVDSLPDGLQTFVGEHGVRISGGERQRVAVARALLADFPVLVLDEPGEHLDTATADALTSDVLAETAGQTVVLITHREPGLDGIPVLRLGPSTGAQA